MYASPAVGRNHWPHRRRVGQAHHARKGSWWDCCHNAARKRRIGTRDLDWTPSWSLRSWCFGRLPHVDCWSFGHLGYLSLLPKKDGPHGLVQTRHHRQQGFARHPPMMTAQGFLRHMRWVAVSAVANLQPVILKGLVQYGEVPSKL